MRDSQIIQQTIVSLSICWRGVWRLGGRVNGQNNMVGNSHEGGWMDGWMIEKGLNATVDPKLIRPDFVMITNVVIRIMRIKETKRETQTKIERCVARCKI